MASNPPPRAPLSEQPGSSQPLWIGGLSGYIDVVCSGRILTINRSSPG